MLELNISEHLLKLILELTPFRLHIFQLQTKQMINLIYALFDLTLIRMFTQSLSKLIIIKIHPSLIFFRHLFNGYQLSIISLSVLSI